MHIHAHACMHTHTYMHMCIKGSCLGDDVESSPLARTCMHTCIHTCMHTCIHPYMHTYMWKRAYIRACGPMWSVGEDVVLSSRIWRDLDPAVALTFVVQVGHAPCTMHPVPCTLYPIPYTLYPAPVCTPRAIQSTRCIHTKSTRCIHTCCPQVATMDKVHLDQLALEFPSARRKLRAAAVRLAFTRAMVAMVRACTHTHTHAHTHAHTYIRIHTHV